MQVSSIIKLWAYCSKMGTSIKICRNNLKIPLISWASVTKLSKNETVSMEVLMKVCGALKCDIGDIMELISVDHNTDKQ